jgi:hypothetical protein
VSDKMKLHHVLTRAYRLLLALYPSAFRAEFVEEMQAVFASVLEEQCGEHHWQLFWRELRHWPGSVLKAHLRARRRNMASYGFKNQMPLPRIELLAAMIIFLLPLLSLFEETGISLPDWTNYIILVTFWGSILFALGLAIAKRFPGWSFSYLGFALMLGQVFTPIFPRMASWIYPHFLEAFGANSRWPISISVIYAGIFDFLLALIILLGAFILVNILRLLPYSRPVWRSIHADWTQLSFMLYGGLVFYIMLAFDEYRYENLWKFSAWTCLALGAWLYLRGKGQVQRILALLSGTTVALWIVALAKWMLVPLQKWPTGYPIAPSVTSRWVETGDTLLFWLFMMGVLIAPALTKWLPPSPDPVAVEEGNPINAHTS